MIANITEKYAQLFDDYNIYNISYVVDVMTINHIKNCQMTLLTTGFAMCKVLLVKFSAYYIQRMMNKKS